jgi:hypothetical protein
MDNDVDDDDVVVFELVLAVTNVLLPKSEAMKRVEGIENRIDNHE